jgi:hypothetical protein
MFGKSRFAALTALVLTALVLTALALTAGTIPAKATELHVGNPMFDAILNDALAAHRRYYGVGDPRCPLVRTSDRYGNYTGRIHTCQLPPRIVNGVIEMHSRRMIVGDEDQR